MREAIGGTWITQLVIVFIFLFVAFLTLSMNYSKAFKVKNEVTTIVEKKGGISDDSIQIINNYLNSSGYKEKGVCETGFYGVNITKDKPAWKEVKKGDKTRYNYCIAKVRAVSPNYNKKAYYEVILFFKFNLPVIGDIFTFNVHGQTKDVAYPIDHEYIRMKQNIINEG